jgi:Cu+-exporting ATPase
MNAPTAERAIGRDPVCGMRVDPATANWKADYGGLTYLFCNEGCLNKFRQDPARYVRPASAPQDAPKDTGSRAEFTCPMHPEIVRAQPGSCPICGMALEPRTTTLDERPNPELVDMTRRLTWSIAPAALVLLLGMPDVWPGQPLAHALSARALQWIELVLASTVVVWAGWPFFERGVASVAHRSLNMFTLIALGTAEPPPLAASEVRAAAITSSRRRARGERTFPRAECEAFAGRPQTSVALRRKESFLKPV